MADNKIEVEYITTVAGALQAIEKLNKRLDDQENKLQKIGTTSKKSADLAAGSFNKLEQELKEATAALRTMTMGTKQFDEQKKKVDELAKSFGKVKQGMKEVNAEGGKTSGVATEVLSKVGGMVAGFVSMSKLAEAISYELDKAKNIQLQQAATSRTIEQALADLGQNVGAEQLPVARKMIADRAPELGVTQEGLANLIGVGISAGAKDLTEAMDLAAAALKLTVGDSQRALALVGGTLDVASLGGSTNFEGALGQLLQTQSQVRSTNLPEFAANIGPGLAAATADGRNQKGVSTERALEMASVISQIIKDPTGSNTATTMRYLFTRMNAFVPELEKVLDDGGVAKVSKQEIGTFSQLKTFDERLKMMQDVPAIGQQFLETQRESIGKTAISEIIAKSDRAVAFEQKAAGIIQSIDEAQGAFTGLVSAVGKETPVLQAARRGEAAVQSADRTGPGALEGQARELFDKAIGQVNLSGFDYVAETLAGWDAKAVKIESAGNAADAYLRTLQTQQSLAGGGFSERDRQIFTSTIAELKSLSGSINALIAEQKKPVPVKVQGPAVRPKEAPLPAATAP